MTMKVEGVNPSVIKRGNDDIVIEKNDGWIELKDGDKLYVLIDDSYFTIKKIEEKKAPSKNDTKTKINKRKIDDDEDNDEDNNKNNKRSKEKVKDNEKNNQKKRKVNKKSEDEDNEEEDEVRDNRNMCKYGANCFRKNEDHLREYKHPPGHFSNTGSSKTQISFSQPSDMRVTRSKTGSRSSSPNKRNKKKQVIMDEESDEDDSFKKPSNNKGKSKNKKDYKSKSQSQIFSSTLPVLSSIPLNDFRIDIHRSKVNPKKIKIVKKKVQDENRPNTIDPSQDLLYMSVRDESPLYLSKSFYIKETSNSNKNKNIKIENNVNNNKNNDDNNNNNNKNKYDIITNESYKKQKNRNRDSTPPLDDPGTPSLSGSQTPPLSPNSSLLIQASIRESQLEDERIKRKKINDMDDSSSEPTSPLDRSRSRSGTPEIDIPKQPSKTFNIAMSDEDEDDEDNSRTPPMSPEFNINTSSNSPNNSSTKNTYILMLPSISTTSLLFDAKIAAKICTPLINQFFQKYKEDNYKIVFIDEEKRVTQLFQKNINDDRFICKNTNDIFSVAKFEQQKKVLVYECCWRFKSISGSISGSIPDDIKSDLQQDIKKQHRIGQEGHSYRLNVDKNSPLYKNENIFSVFFSIGPNMCKNKRDFHESYDTASPVLENSYKSIFDEFSKIIQS